MRIFWCNFGSFLEDFGRVLKEFEKKHISKHCSQLANLSSRVNKILKEPDEMLENYFFTDVLTFSSRYFFSNLFFSFLRGACREPLVDQKSMTDLYLILLWKQVNHLQTMQTHVSCSNKLCFQENATVKVR